MEPVTILFSDRAAAEQVQQLNRQGHPKKPQYIME